MGYDGGHEQGSSPGKLPSSACTCCCKRDMVQDQNGNHHQIARDEEGRRIWKDMRKNMYKENIVELISSQRPGALAYLVDKEKLTSADFGYRIHFSDLQKIHMRFLHSKIASLAVSAHLDDEEWKPGGKAEEIGQVLKEYVQAVKDHEYMGKYAMAGSNDPFIATSQRLYDKLFLESAMKNQPGKAPLMPMHFLPSLPPQPLRWHKQHDRLPLQKQDLKKEGPTPIERLQKQATSTGPWEDDNTASSSKPASVLISTRTQAWKRAYWNRIGAGLIGGAFLIAPMWILALQRNLYVHLGVATGCIAAFGGAMSLYLETVDSVFAATLAYAAVIMVFVGIVIQETGGKGA